MKKINIIIIAILVIVMASCASQSTPKNAVRTYYNALQDEEFYEASQLCLSSTNTEQAAQQSEQLRNKYSKFVKRYKILGVEEISDTEAFAVVRIKSPLYEITGDMLEVVYLTKSDDKWYIGRKPTDLEELLKSYQESQGDWYQDIDEEDDDDEMIAKQMED